MLIKNKPIAWVGSSKKDLMALPLEVRKFFGHALDFAQRGDKHDAAKVLKGFGGAGILELVDNDQDGTYRAVYTVKFAKAVFVLHCFSKKSKRGIETPKEDIDIIRARLKVAEALAKELWRSRSREAALAAATAAEATSAAKAIGALMRKMKRHGM